MPMLAEAPRIFLVAGEPSGDALGAGLIAAVRDSAPDAICRGVGGPGMAAAGMDLAFPYDDLAVMGLVEVLPRYFRIRRRWREVMAAIDAFDPDVVVTIDSSGFNKPIAKRLIATGSTARRVHYVAPMVWAWRPGRARSMSQLYHHLLVLFPFEPPFFTEHGLATSYVGHLATEQLAGNGGAFRAAHGIPSDAPVVAVLPGSRRGELSRLLPIFEQALLQMATEFPGLTLVCPTVPLVKDLVHQAVARTGLPAVVTDSPTEKADAFAAADVAIAASGTVTLELALARVPMVVAYRVNSITAAIGKRLLSVSSAGLPNLLSGRPVVSECLQDRCRPEHVAAEALRLIRDPAAREAQLRAFDEVRRALQPPAGSPSAAAAAIVLHEAALRRATVSDPKDQ
jgi:lipid-A-disaccharide synthase